MLPRAEPPREPVFVVGAPRSGTTMVFDILNHSAALSSLRHESQLLWDMFHPIEGRGWSSHELGPESITMRERRVLAWAIGRVTLGHRYLDKLPRNSLRVPYLHGLFPDAWFVFVRRDGRANVSSLITGWRVVGKFGKGTRPPVPLAIEGYEGGEWKFIAPGRWQEYATGKSLSEVCAFQWIAANTAILEARERIGTDHWVDVSYEDLVAKPVETVSDLSARLRIPFDEEMRSFSARLDRHVAKTAVTAPRPDKWREENAEEVARILPMIAPMMGRLGYEVG